ncbi:MAG: fatty acid--CoA ligase family protein [bacterium]
MEDPQRARHGTVGKVLDGTEVLIVDGEGNEVPPGQSGRICGRGPHCNGGYFNDRAATDSCWQGGFFDTGDLGRIDPDGFLVLEGRVKDVIIRGGQNISAGEVEAILAGHPAIVEAAVVPMADEEMGERACAFVVAVEGRQLSLGDVVAFMKGQGVAAFMIPERLELIREMPTNSAGKVDKSLLGTRVAETIKRERPAG